MIAVHGFPPGEEKLTIDLLKISLYRCLSLNVSIVHIVHIISDMGSDNVKDLGINAQLSGNWQFLFIFFSDGKV